MSYRNVTFGAVVTTEPQLTYTPAGEPHCRFEILHTRRVKNDDTGKWEDGPTTTYAAVIRYEAAEHASESLRLGDRVLIDGRIDDTGELSIREIGLSLKNAPAHQVRAERRGGTDEPNPT